MNLPCIKSVENSQFSPLVYEKGLVAEAEELMNEIHAMRRNLIRLADTNPKSDYRNAHSSSRLVTLSKHKQWLEKNCKLT
jgi:hypothetical protein